MENNNKKTPQSALSEGRPDVDFTSLLESLIGRLVFLTLKNGTKLKGDVATVNDGMVKLRSLKNIHYISVDEINHVAVAESLKDESATSLSQKRDPGQENLVGGMTSGAPDDFKPGAPCFSGSKEELLRSGAGAGLLAAARPPVPLQQKDSRQETHREGMM